MTRKPKRRNRRARHPRVDIDPMHTRVEAVCATFDRYKLTPKEIAIFAQLSVERVEAILVELRQKERLPLQYLDHKLN
jgi:hypothetical protein